MKLISDLSWTRLVRLHLVTFQSLRCSLGSARSGRLAVKVDAPFQWRDGQKSSFAGADPSSLGKFAGKTQTVWLALTVANQNTDIFVQRETIGRFPSPPLLR